MTKHQRPEPRDPQPRDPKDAKRREEGTLGYAQDAGHPGGEQDLDAKTEREADHDGA